MFETFQCFVANGFGATEAGGMAHGAAGEALQFSPKCEWKLRSIPELGYDADGDPPRGELLVKTPTQAIGYFKRSDQTRSAFRDGFYCTGDVVRVENGSVYVIDRAKNFIKLQQGEFVAVEQLESIFTSCPLVEQIIVHADPLQNFVVAIVVPNESLKVRQQATETNDEEMLILQEIASVSVDHSLQGFEVPRGIANCSIIIVEIMNINFQSRHHSYS